jgi:hypothetical protein
VKRHRRPVPVGTAGQGGQGPPSPAST